MKSILISIKPEWVAKILNGEKTVEIRKTYPHCELPCKVYIYCTKSKPLTSFGVKSDGFVFEKLNGKVVAEFTLNTLYEFEFELYPNGILASIGYVWYNDDGDWLLDMVATGDDVEKTPLLKQAQLSVPQLRDYLGTGCHSGYAWFIDNLVIYEEPKELSEFNIANKKCVEDCQYSGNECMLGICKQLKRPPQSWCYVEEC